MDLRINDLLFYKGDGYISKIIEKFTNSQYSHVALVLDEYHLVEIDWKYRLKINHISYNKKSFDIYRLKNEMTKEQINKKKIYIYKALGMKYDYLEIFKILLNIIFKVKLKDNNDKSVCSSWNAMYFGFDKGLYTPQDLIDSGLFYQIEKD